MRRPLSMLVWWSAVALVAFGCKSEEPKEAKPAGEEAGESGESGESEGAATGESGKSGEAADEASGEGESGGEASDSDGGESGDAADEAVAKTGEAIPIPAAPAVTDGQPKDLGRIAVLAERISPVMRLDRPEDFMAWVREVTGSHPIVDAMLADLGALQVVLELPTAGRDVTRPVYLTMPEVVVDVSDPKAWTRSTITHISLPAADPAGHRDAVRDALAKGEWTTEGAPPISCIPAGCVALRFGTSARGVVLAPRADDVLMIEVDAPVGTSMDALGKTLDTLVVDSAAKAPALTVALDHFLQAPPVANGLSAWLELTDLEELSLRLAFQQIDDAMKSVPSDMPVALLASGGAAAFSALSLAHGRGEVLDITATLDPASGLRLVHSLTANGRAIHAALGSEDVALPAFDAADGAALSMFWRGNLGAGVDASPREATETLAMDQAQRLVTNGGIWTMAPTLGQPWFLLARVVASDQLQLGFDPKTTRGAVMHLTPERPEIALVLDDAKTAEALTAQPSELPWVRVGKGPVVVFSQTEAKGWSEGKEAATGPFTFSAVVRVDKVPAGALPKEIAPLLKLLPEGDVRIRRGVGGPEGSALVDQVIVGEGEWPALPELTAHAAVAAPGEGDPQKCAYDLVEAYAQVLASVDKLPPEKHGEMLGPLSKREAPFAALSEAVDCAKTDARFAGRVTLIDGLVARMGAAAE